MIKVDLAAAAVIGRGCQTQAAGQLAPVGKAPPAEHLLDQHPSTFGPDRAQLGQLRHLRLRAGLHLKPPLCLERIDLLLDQRQPRVLALDLGAQQRRYLLAVAFPPARPVASANDDVRAKVVQLLWRSPLCGQPAWSRPGAMQLVGEGGHIT